MYLANNFLNEMISPWSSRVTFKVHVHRNIIIDILIDIIIK